MSSTSMLNSLVRLITFKQLLINSCKRNSRRMPIEGCIYNFTCKYLFERIMKNFYPISWYTFSKTNKNFYIFLEFSFSFSDKGIHVLFDPERTNPWAHNPQHMRHINPMECHIRIMGSLGGTRINSLRGDHFETKVSWGWGALLKIALRVSSYLKGLQPGGH